MKQYLLTLLITMCFIFSQDCEEPINVWFKISNDINSNNYGKIIPVDMSSGYAYSDGAVVYLLVFDKESKEQLVLMFPFGYWEAGGEIEKEFKDLEDYLKYNNDKGIEIQKNNKVGE